MQSKRFIMIAGRTTKQGQQVNIGKDYPEYLTMTTTLTMNGDDMKALGLANGAKVIARTDCGEETFTCQEGKVPPELIFVPYGPPTCKLMGGSTDGTGMPTSKGWECEIEPIAG